MTTDQAKRDVVLAALRRSADAHNGVPVWKAVERETGVTRDTLRRWWERFKNVHALPSPRQDAAQVAVVSASSGPEQLLESAPEVFYAWMVEELRADLRAARTAFEFGAMSQLYKRMDEAYSRGRPALERARRTGRGLTPEQVREEVRRIAEGFGAPEFEVFLQVARERKMI
jgi:ribosomal protein L39E